MDTMVSTEASAGVHISVSTPASAHPRPDNMGRAKIVVGAVILVVALSLGMARAANRAGWVPHREDTTVYFGRSNWAVGEERSCIALPESDGAIIFLSCVARTNPELSPEVWPVTYWGQTRRADMFDYVHANPGMHTWDWRCRRYRNSVTCWAVN
jgi:hypothetical protein